MTIQEFEKGIIEDVAIDKLITCEPYLLLDQKIQTARIMADGIKDAEFDSQEKYELFMYLYIRITFVQMYSDIELPGDDIYEAYDYIMGYGIFDYVMSVTGETEYEDFKSICEILIPNRS